jgi:septin family protein
MDKHIEAEENNHKKGLPFPDERVHCCLFFLSGPWISDHDLQIMQKMAAITNLIPIIAKSDTYTTTEIREFKRRIVERSKIENVNWFSIEEILRQNYPEKLALLLEGTFGRSPPFAIACCTEKEYNQLNRKYEMVRDYKWGKCELNNETHNDFKFLKELLISYLSDILIRSTDILERSYAMKKMSQSRKSAKSQGG